MVQVKKKGNITRDSSFSVADCTSEHFFISLLLQGGWGFLHGNFFNKDTTKYIVTTIKDQVQEIGSWLCRTMLDCGGPFYK